MWSVIALFAGLAGATPTVEPTEAEAPQAVAWREPSPCGWSVGVAAGAYLIGANTTWETVGGSPWEATASPLVAANCTLGKGPLKWWVGAESAPFYVHVRPDGLKMRQFATGSVGFLAGSKSVQFGPYVTGGFTAAGGGVRVVATWPNRPGRFRNRFELRATAYALGSPGIQGSFLYSFSVPRRQR